MDDVSAELPRALPSDATFVPDSILTNGPLDRLPSAVLFDMDGTLTVPYLDFPALKRELGIGDKAILEAIELMGPAERLAAEVILHRHEETAARLSDLNPGCRELLAWLHERGVHTALITRNSRASVEIVFARHGLPIDVLITREDAPPKPDPEPLLQACRRLGTSLEESWMVGDGVYDVQAGRNAGIRTVWLSHGRQQPFADVPWATVSDLWGVIRLLETCTTATAPNS